MLVLFLSLFLQLLVNCDEVAQSNCSPHNAPTVADAETICGPNRCVIVCGEDFYGWDILECVEEKFQAPSETFACEKAFGRVSDDTITDEIRGAVELLKLKVPRSTVVARAMLTRYYRYKTDLMALYVESLLQQEDADRRQLGFWEQLGKDLGDSVVHIQDFLAETAAPIHDAETSLLLMCMDEDSHGWPWNTGTLGWCHCNFGFGPGHTVWGQVKCSWNCHFGPCYTCLSGADYRRRRFAFGAPTNAALDPVKVATWDNHCPGIPNEWKREL